MVFGDYVFTRFTKSRLHNGNYDRNQRKRKKKQCNKKQEFANKMIWFNISTL